MTNKELEEEVQRLRQAVRFLLDIANHKATRDDWHSINDINKFTDVFDKKQI